MFPGSGSQFTQPHQNVLVQANIIATVFGAKRLREESNKTAKQKQIGDFFIRRKAEEQDQKTNDAHGRNA